MPKQKQTATPQSNPHLDTLAHPYYSLTHTTVYRHASCIVTRRTAADYQLSSQSASCPMALRSLSRSSEQQFLYFFPLPHTHGWLAALLVRLGCGFTPTSAPADRCVAPMSVLAAAVPGARYAPSQLSSAMEPAIRAPPVLNAEYALICG